MKLHKSLLMFGASALLLAACAGDTGEEPTEEVTDDTEVVEDVEADESEEVVEEPVANSTEIVLGQPIEFADFTVTITGYETTTDYDGNPMLKYTYDWINTSDETLSPFMTFDITGFQSGVSTETSPFADTVDYGKGQVEVRPEGIVEGAEGAIGLTSADEPLELELTEIFSFGDEAYTTTINPADYN